MPVWRMRVLARTSRCPIVAGATRKAAAYGGGVEAKPSTVCRISGARIAGLIAGCAGAGKHQRQPLVRHVGVACLQFHGLALLADQQQVILRVDARPEPPLTVDGASPRDRQQPRLRSVGHAIRRPMLQCCGEGVGQRILGGGHVAAAGGQHCEQPAVTLPGGGLRRRPRVPRFRHGTHATCISQIGRTSIVPFLAPGQRVAQAMAASRSGASIL